ncbi:hypothetical protein AURDEDRAFT_114199 [Auricularia subglabra TFB-10046 SS5]|nr:hypothetical protein AURDEDRAFT_114199 [Auricularia subglabra TFB-10046 SS5]
MLSLAEPFDKPKNSTEVDHNPSAPTVEANGGEVGKHDAPVIGRVVYNADHVYRRVQAQSDLLDARSVSKAIEDRGPELDVQLELRNGCSGEVIPPVREYVTVFFVSPNEGE